MKESYLTYFFILMGGLGLFLINTFGNVVLSNEQNYYLLKEITEAAMLDSVDMAAYRSGVGWDGVTIETDPESMHCLSDIPGTVRIVKEKFVENFIRRFSESVDLNRQYRIIVHDIDECPPKVSISLIASERFSFFQFFNVHYNTDAQIINTLTGILESKTPATYDE